MTEDLRALLRADLSSERPPPLGDLVAAAIRDGRRIRRKQRIRRIGAGVLALAAAVSALVITGDGGVAGRRYAPSEAAGALSPPSVPPAEPVPTSTAEARTLTLRSGTKRAGGSREKATSAAMLHLLTQLLPPGRTTHLGVAAPGDLQVQLYLDDGSGPGIVRVAVDQNGPIAGDLPRAEAVSVTISHMPDNCLQGTVVDAAWPDGTLVQVDVASCLDPAGPATVPALSVDQAVRVATDPRWGVTMDAALVAEGAKQFPTVPVLG